MTGDCTKCGAKNIPQREWPLHTGDQPCPTMPRPTTVFVATHNHPDHSTTVLGVAKTMASAISMGDKRLNTLQLTRGDIHPDGNSQWAKIDQGGFLWFAPFNLQD